MIIFLRIAVGLGVLTLGRQLFWLFIAGVGFIFGLNLATEILNQQSNEAILIIALIMGIIGALFALFLQRVAIGIAGFLGGSVIAISLVDMLNLEIGSVLVPFLLGGIIGAILIAVLFDWALIIISSFTGATVIVQSVSLEYTTALVLLVVLSLFGIVVQARQMGRESRS